MKYETMKLKLWEGKIGDEAAPNTMTLFLQKTKKSLPLVLILPGGGYGHLSDREGEPIAKKFLAAGYHAGFLHYSLAPNRYPAPLLDVIRGLGHILQIAPKEAIDIDHIFVMGFSAGGHLAAMVANLYKEPWLWQEAGVDLSLLTLKGSILSYPVISSGPYRHDGSFRNLIGDQGEKSPLWSALSMETRVHEATPPTFIWHTASDGAVPVQNALDYAAALVTKKVPVELHVFPEGGHGLALCTQETAMGPEHVVPSAAVWLDLCLAWLKRQVSATK